ncbi:hypothetical protein GGX14DRAFT_694688 [Mycena pura]|uniref:Uncharacterized protein n=1 Tax=Mycena pura TaxID=153505 RepID=A0AAD6VUV3_9AGAR|nr:hypothetical protein GGX14DRAFT_694688 [Mycena pura]
MAQDAHASRATWWHEESGEKSRNEDPELHFGAPLSRRKCLHVSLPAGKCGPGTGCNAPVTATDLRLGASVLFRADPDFPLFNAALGEALGGDASKFAYVPAGDIRETVVVPLLCSDLKSEDKSFAAFQALSANSNASDPAQMVYSQIWQFVLMCDAWPFDAPEPATLPTDLPLMWVTSDFDLKCARAFASPSRSKRADSLPTELTTFAFAQAPNSTLVIRHGDDHTSIDLPNVASHALEIDFLRTGVFPAAQDGAQVTVVPPGGTRARAPLDPYAVPLGIVAGDASTIETLPDSVLPPAAPGASASGALAASAGRRGWRGGATVSTLLFVAAAIV